MNQAQTVFVPLRFQIDIFTGRDASSSSSAVQSDEHSPPTYVSSPRPENNAAEEADLDDVLPGYEDATRSIDNTPIEGCGGRDLVDLKAKSAE
jgi:hypothetical protein